MIKEHHAALIYAASDVAKHLVKEGKKEWERVSAFLNPIMTASSFDLWLATIARWTAEVDNLNDLTIDEQFSGNVMAAIGHPTSFQHFAYRGYLYDLRDGDKVTKYGDGYCWDTDPFLPWYAELANASVANVSYNPKCGFLPESILKESPGAKMIKGDTDWDNQIYPSAVDLREFYLSVAVDLQHTLPGYALRALCCALHLTQDLCVPHHRLNTIGKDHSKWERDVYAYWQRCYSGRSTKSRQGQIVRMAEIVNDLANSPWVTPNIAAWPIPEPNKLVAFNVSCCAIKDTLQTVWTYLESEQIKVEL